MIVVAIQLPLSCLCGLKFDSVVSKYLCEPENLKKMKGQRQQDACTRGQTGQGPPSSHEIEHFYLLYYALYSFEFSNKNLFNKLKPGFFSDITIV